MTTGDTGLNLLDCLKEVSSLLDGAYKVSLKEQDALVKNDAEQLTLSCRAQEEILRRICEVDQRASAVTAQLAEETGMDLSGANADAVAEAAGFPYTNLIRNETKLIAQSAEKVREANEINTQLLRNGLDIIACCLRTLATDMGPGVYSRNAGLNESRPYILSLNRQA